MTVIIMMFELIKCNYTNTWQWKLMMIIICNSLSDLLCVFSGISTCKTTKAMMWTAPRSFGKSYGTSTTWKIDSRNCMKWMGLWVSTKVWWNSRGDSLSDNSFLWNLPSGASRCGLWLRAPPGMYQTSKSTPDVREGVVKRALHTA